jgi:hypothetical protein
MWIRQIISVTLFHQSLCCHQYESNASNKGHQKGKKFETSNIVEILQIKPDHDRYQYNLYDHKDKDHGRQCIAIVAQGGSTKIQKEARSWFQCF